MATLFIADLHLCVEEPAITAGFLRFLAGEARKADALYILGDLFEAWIGDDDPNPLHRQMAAAIKAVSDSGVPCYFIHGNRDFLLGKRFAREIQHDEQFPFVSGMMAISPLGGFVPVEWKNRKRHTITA